MSETLHESIKNQINDLSSDNKKFSLNSESADEGQVKEKIGSFSLESGPADVPSYHDLSVLHLAFESVWEEVFDKNLGQYAERLYEEAFELAEQAGYTELTSSLSNAQELENFRDEIERLNASIAGADDRYKTVKRLVPELTVMQWANLDEATRQTVFIFVEEGLEAKKIDELRMTLAHMKSIRTFSSNKKWDLDESIEKLEILIASLEGINPNAVAEQAYDMIIAGQLVRQNSLANLLEDIDERLKEPYCFDVYAKGSVNYGLLVTYRQKWDPLNYQVGELVSTIPLAPGETRTYTKKTVEHKKRSEKEIEKALETKKQESSDKSRVDFEIVQKAQQKNNFSASAETKGKIGVFNVSGKTSVDKDSAKDSKEVKKRFREATFKSAQEYKNEHHLEISTEESLTDESSSTTNITNPNQEIPVTYLFYELQRRYEISEKLYSVTPVILVANQVPQPHEIDEDWIITYDWILRRVMLDDSFISAMDYLSTGQFVGDSLSLEILRGELERQLRIVDKLVGQVATKRKIIDQTLRTINKLVQQKASVAENEASEGLLGKGKDLLFGSPKTEANEGIKISEEHKREVLDRIMNESSSLEQQLDEEINSLEKTSTKYSNTVKLHFSKKHQINRLRIHIKENIFYYMQAIWSYEYEDQRFFRIKNTMVPTFNVIYDLTTSVVSARNYLSSGNNANASRTKLTNFVAGLTQQIENAKSPPNEKIVDVDLKIPIREFTIGEQPITNVADIRNLLGFIGNYMVFPLKESNQITDYMMQDYIDETMGGVVDPDEYANNTFDEVKEILEELYETNPEAFTPEYSEQMKKILKQRLTDTLKEKETISVPSNSLFIEALPGTKAVLEQFKLIHRGLDVEKFKEKLLQERLETIRKTGRLLNSKFDDEIDKKVVVNGNNDSTVTNVET